MKKLIIAGTGIKFLSHLTYETQAAIKSSDCVLYLLNEPAIKKWIQENSKKSLSLDDVYFADNERKESYKKIEEKVEDLLECHEKVCFLTYGNPVFFSSFTSNIASRARSLGADVEVFPAISSLDCIYSDLEIDPSEKGVQSFEATSFILNDQSFSSDTPLVIWQVGVIGITDIIRENIDIERRRAFLQLFIKKLSGSYPLNHQCFLYVASQYPGLKPVINKMTLEELGSFDIDRLTTLYIPEYKEKTTNTKVLSLLKKS